MPHTRSGQRWATKSSSTPIPPPILVASRWAKTLVEVNLAVTPGAQNYSLTVTQAKTGSTFTIAKDATGNVTRTCSTAGQKGCPASGTW